jgi:hypothetical protein
MTYSGSVVLEKKIFQMTPTHFLIFCDYLPFEDDLALYFDILNPLYPRKSYTKFD